MGESPTSLKRYLGAQLRQLRVAAGLKPVDVMEELACSRSKVTKIERGQVGIREKELEALLRLYKAEPDLAAGLVEVAREARKRGWWASENLTSSVPPFFRTFIGLEASAEEIWTYQSELVPGLLQTEAYSRAVVNAVSPNLDVIEVERRLKVRKQRQARLIGLSPPRIVAVVNEGVVREVIGGPEVMREQLRFLIDIQKEIPVEVRVKPFAAGAHPVIGFNFVVLRDHDHDEPTTVYVDGLTKADYLDAATDPQDLAIYTEAFERLRTVALPADESRTLIASVMADL
ncbi:MAG: helix-turn-helix transcriptional regulator [Umezawaea sp.]